LTKKKLINLLLIRDTFSENSVIGELFLNGERMCDTLENPWINNKKNVSCIPRGEYKVCPEYDPAGHGDEYL